jgi:ABC-type polysaccharide/polyol phosphate transport system ATPase subunit
MSDWVIRARDLSKVYRLYARPHHRLLDVVGLMRSKRYHEHAALDGVSVEIRRGEKIVLIGRNGAGKSTFLKLVTKVIPPTSGELEVKGRVQALLQIGTGFHPDFTGRQNVYAYLAQLGISGREAEAKIAEIIDFAEIEEYIDQPTKTYSTGMGARLMFATSTAITPDVLVLDEILGVGDAYFAQKSFERMRTLCEAEGTTLLLVTHDVYSALRIASRVIWIDRGRVLMDGDGPAIVNAYEDSIRLQEEHRLRLKKQQHLQQSTGMGKPPKRLLVEIHAKDARPQRSPVFFSRVGLCQGERLLAELPLGADAFAEAAPSHLQREATCWGEATSWQGRACRPMLNYGSPFHKVAGWLEMPSDVADKDAQLELVLDYGSEEACELSLRAFFGEGGVDLGRVRTTPGVWTRQVSRLAESAASNSLVPEINTSGVLGTGRIVVEDVTVLDADGRPSHFVRHGEPITLAIDYRIVDPQIREHAQVVVAFHGGGVPTACRLTSRELFFDATRAPRGRILLHVSRLALGRGTYQLTVLVAKEGYYEEGPAVFYAINPGLYYCLSRFMEIEVTGGGVMANGTIFVGEGEWSVEPAVATPTASASRPGDAPCAE